MNKRRIHKVQNDFTKPEANSLANQTVSAYLSQIVSYNTNK